MPQLKDWRYMLRGATSTLLLLGAWYEKLLVVCGAWAVFVLAEPLVAAVGAAPGAEQHGAGAQHPRCRPAYASVAKTASADATMANANNLDIVESPCKS
jgi:hypothetical protein